MLHGLRSDGLSLVVGLGRDDSAGGKVIGHDEWLLLSGGQVRLLLMGDHWLGHGSSVGQHLALSTGKHLG